MVSCSRIFYSHQPVQAALYPTRCTQTTRPRGAVGSRKGAQRSCRLDGASVVRRDAAINRTEAALAALANALILQLRLTCSRLRGDLVVKDDLNDRPWHAPSVAAPA